MDSEKSTKLAALKEELRRNHIIGPPFANPDQLAAQLVTDLHNWLFDKYLVQGITTLRTDYSTRIQNFLTEYLGTPEQPVPFGGRKADLEKLDNWLDDSRQPPYLLLAARRGGVNRPCWCDGAGNCWGGMMWKLSFSRSASGFAPTWPAWCLPL